MVAGEIHTIPGLYEKAEKEIPDLVRQVIREVGYDNSFPGIDPDRCEVRIKLNRQSDNIRQGVDQKDGVVGAGDQGMMFGYACDETPELMPLPIMLAHRLVQRQAELRRSGEIPWLRPDAKSQVSVRYSGDIPVAVETVVLSTQHAENVDLATVQRWYWRASSARSSRKNSRPQLQGTGQPDRPFRHRRSLWRYRPHRPEDHRRYLRRSLSSWWRRVLRQGSVQGGSISSLCGPACGQEHRCRWVGQAVHGADCLCHRGGGTGFSPGRHAWHRACP